MDKYHPQFYIKFYLNYHITFAIVFCTSFECRIIKFHKGMEHCERSLKNMCHSFCVTFRDWRKTSSQVMNFDHIEAKMRYCILHRLYPTSRFDWDDITIIKLGEDYNATMQHSNATREWRNFTKMAINSCSSKTLCSRLLYISFT
jgi:hypothetical protein